MAEIQRPAARAGSGPGRRRPLLPVLFGFASGVVLQEFFPAPLSVLLFAAIPAIAISCLLLARRAGASAMWLCAFLLFLPTGALWHRQRYQTLPPSHIKYRLARRPGLIRVRARVSEPPRQWQPKDPFQLAARQDRQRWMMGVEILRVLPASGGHIRSRGGVTVFGEGALPGVHYGDVVEFLADFRPNPPPSNPGERPTGIIYERGGSYGIGGGVLTEGVKIVRRTPWYRTPRTAAESLRALVRGRLLQLRDRDGAHVHPLVRSLMLGERHLLPPGLQRDLEDAGVIHFLAISGLHVGIFAAGIWLFLTLTGIGVAQKHVALIALIWIYALFTGARISSIRAALMVSMLAGAPLLHRRPDPPSTLAGAALIILLWRPQELFSAGFHLTFLAVLSILFVYPPLKDMLLPWRRAEDQLRREEEISITESVWIYGSDYFLLCTGIWLITAPLTAYHFNRYSLLLPLLNMVLWPLVLLLVLNSFLGILLLPLGSAPFAVFNRLSSLLGRGIEDILSYARNLPGFVRHTPGPPIWWLALYYALIISCLGARQRRRKFQFALVGALILTVSLLICETRESRLGHLRITVTDLGHGKSVMLRLPEGGVMLYDAGSNSYSTLGGLCGVLWHNRTRRLGALVISHRHFDHYSFTPALSDKFGIHRILIPPRGADEYVHPRIQAILMDSAEEYVRVMDGTRISAGGLEARFLHPDMRFLAENGVGRNDRSAVLMGRYGDWRFLLTGDADDAALERIVAEHGGDLQAEVLLLPHHGAWAENLDTFIDAVNPAVAVASSGEPLGRDVRNLLDSRGIAVWSTYDDGAVTFELYPAYMRVEGFSSGRTQLAPRRR